MTREETVKIIRIMVDSYPNYKPNDISETVNVWCMMLSDYTYEQVSIALKAYITSDTSGFAPAIGQLIAKIQSVTQPHELNEIEAWALVSKAIRNSSYNSVEEYAKLPPLVQKAVGLPEQLRTWAIDENYNEEVVMSHFCRCFRGEVARHQELSKMPSEVQRIVIDVSKGSYVAQLEDLRVKTIEGITERIESEVKQIEKTSGVPMPQAAKEKLERILNQSEEK